MIFFVLLKVWLNLEPLLFAQEYVNPLTPGYLDSVKLLGVSLMVACLGVNTLTLLILDSPE